MAEDLRIYAVGISTQIYTPFFGSCLLYGVYPDSNHMHVFYGTYDLEISHGAVTGTEYSWQWQHEGGSAM